MDATILLDRHCVLLNAYQHRRKHRYMSSFSFHSEEYKRDTYFLYGGPVKNASGFFYEVSPEFLL